MINASMTVLEGSNPGLMIGAFGHVSSTNEDGFLAYYEASSLQGHVQISEAESSRYYHGVDNGLMLSQTGCSVNSAGDVNGDGSEDVLLGSCGWVDGGDSVGSVHLLYGPF